MGHRRENTDELKPGSIWTADREWVNALEEGDRVLRVGWGHAALPENLDALVMAATMTQNDAALVTLGYRFTNFADCRAANSKPAKDAL